MTDARVTTQGVIGGFSLTGLSVRDSVGNVVVQDVTFGAAPGEAVVVIGETGSGKSLIAQAMLGLLPPGFVADGTLRIAGLPEADLWKPAAARRLWSRGTLLLPQEPRAALDPTMRVGFQLSDDADTDRAVAMLRSVGLAPAVRDAFPFALSGGMAQRVLVSMANGSAAPLIVVDEPTKGLDPDRVGQVIRLLGILLREGRSLLVITHDITLARGLPGRVAVLRDGGIVECRAAEALFATPRHDYTRRWVAADPAQWTERRPVAKGDVVLAARDLGFGYRGGPRLFGGIDITVRRGGVVALMGASGSGKTTLGNVLIGLCRPDEGRVDWAGVDPYAGGVPLSRLRRRYQKLHQDPSTAFVPHRKLHRQFHDLAEVVPDLDVGEKLPPLLDRLGVHAATLGRYAAEVSGGEAQRLALARVLLLDPVLIVADEPTSRLDPITQRDTIALLCDVLRDRGVGLVLISHDRLLVASLTDQIIGLKSNVHTRLSPT